MSFYILEGFVHIATISISALAAGMLIIIVYQKIISFTTINKTLLLLSLTLLSISILYFIIDYYSTIIGISGCNAIVRIIDAWLTVSMQYLWFIFSNSLTSFCKSSSCTAAFKYIYILLMISTAVTYGYLMDSTYNVTGSPNISIALIDEILFIIIFDFTNICCIKKNISLLCLTKSGTHVYKICLIGCFLMILECTQSGIIGIKLISQALIIQNFMFCYIPGIRLMFAVIIMVYVIKHCFLAQYQIFPQMLLHNDKPIDRQKILEEIAATANLTKQEKTIMNLLYAGATYKDIAAHLYISINTVKHHITSIYKKIGVSSKLELLELVKIKSENLNN